MSAQRPKLVLKPDRCDACGRCVEECRHNAIRVGVGYIYVDWNRCDGCGKCRAWCDREAILERGPAVSPSSVPARPSGGLELGAGEEPKPRRGRLWRPKSGTPGVGTPAEPPVSALAGPIPWRLGEAAVVVVAALGLQVGTQFLLACETVRSLSGGDALLARGVVLGLYYALQVALLLALALRRHAGFAATFRLDTPPDPMSVPLGLAMLVGTWAFAVLYRLLAMWGGWIPSASADLTQVFGSDAVGMLVTVLVVVLLGPFVEELLLRGVLLGALEQRWDRWPAIGVSALVFATLHGNLWSFLPLTVLGLALGRMASRRRSLWPAIILHVAYNAVLVAAAYVQATRG